MIRGLLDTGAVTSTPDPAPTSLCLLTRTTGAGRREVLLGMKKTGFGKGKYVGPGGHIEPGETAAQAAVREVREESGLEVEPADLRDLGLVTFRFPFRPAWDLSVAVFGAERFAGEPAESDEIAPQWFPTDALPLAQMWDDARFWLPQTLDGTYLDAEIFYAEDCEHVDRVVFGPDGNPGLD